MIDLSVTSERDNLASMILLIVFLFSMFVKLITTIVYGRYKKKQEKDVESKELINTDVKGPDGEVD